MTTPRLPRRTRDAIAHSRLYVFFVTPTWLRDPRASAELAYAVHLGKPIRLLVQAGVHLPEDTFLGIADLAVARMQGPEADAAQIEAWLTEVRARRTQL